MEKYILALGEFKDIWQQCTQNLLFRLSDIIRMGLKEKIEEDIAKWSCFEINLKLTG